MAITEWYSNIALSIRRFAPYGDRADVVFGAFLLIAVGVSEFTNILPDPSVLAYLTAVTAFIALYRLRHRPDKIRPAVRQCFNSNETGELTDFRLHNYGPGPALYIQILVRAERGNDFIEVIEIEPRDPPIHLDEGEYVSLVSGRENLWLDERLDTFDDSQEGVDVQDPAMVKLYYSYVSDSGAREPILESASRDDETILSDLVDSDARRIELSKIRDTYRTPE